MSQPYDFKQSEPAWTKFWDVLKLYEFNPEGEKTVYSIDTPPPTVSGDLHIGHCFSYTQADAVARFWRMKGHRIFYPFGFDDNAFPPNVLSKRRTTSVPVRCLEKILLNSV